MRRALLALLGLGALAAGCSRDPVVLIVGERRIPRSRFEADYRRVAESDTTLRGEAGLRTFLDDYINKNVLELLAREKYPTLTPDQVGRQQKTERSVLRDAIRRRNIGDRVRPPTEEEALAFHNLRKNGYVARHIMVASRPEAEEILSEVRGGADFAALAAARSADETTAGAGGVIRFRPGVLFPEFEDPVVAMKPGESGIVETPLGFHVVRLDSVVARPDTVSYESERRKIEDHLRARQMRKLRTALHDSLASRYHARVDEEAAAWFDAKAAAAGGRRPIPDLTAEERARVLASFDGGQVTAGDYLECLRDRPPGQIPRGGDVRVQRESVKECLFDALCAAEGKRLGVDREPEIADILRDREEMLRVTRLYDEQVETPAGADEADYRAYYEKHREELVAPEQWRLQVLGVRDSAFVRRVVSEWGAGAAFQDLAARCRAIDSLAVASPEDGVPVLDLPEFAAWVDAVRGKDIGAVGGPAVMDSLYYAVRVMEHAPKRPKSYDEAFDSIRLGAEAERKEARLQQLLAEGKKRFPITVKERALRGVKWNGNGPGRS